MKPARSLHLRKEALGEISAEDLSQVVGGVTTPINTCVFCVTQPSDCVCVTDRPTQCC